MAVDRPSGDVSVGAQEQLLDIPGVAAHDTPGGGWLYVPGELLTPRWAADAVRAAVGDAVAGSADALAGAGRWVRPTPPVVPPVPADVLRRLPLAIRRRLARPDGMQPAAAGPELQPADDGPGWVTGEQDVERAVEAGRMARIPLAADVRLPELLARLRAPAQGEPLPVHPHAVMSFEPVWIGRPPLPPWPAPAPQLAEPTGAASTIAVLDTGIDRSWLERPDLRSRLVDVRDPEDVEVHDADADHRLDLQAGHGTFIAGVIARATSNARILPRRVLSPFGLARDVDVAAAIDAVAPHADVLSLSLGGYTADDLAPPLVDDAIRRFLALGRGGVVVAAAGNAGGSRCFFPAAAKSVVAVGATDAVGRPARFSNHGWWVDCSTHGHGVTSAFVAFSGPGKPAGGGDPDPDDFRFGAVWSGTSFAAPLVAARIAEAAALRAVSHAEAASRLIDVPTARRLPSYGTIL